MFKIPAYLMQQEVNVESYEGNSASGTLYSAPKLEHGRFEPSQERTIDYKGTEVISSGKLYLYATADIKPQSRVTIGGQKYIAIKVTPLMGFKRAWYIEVMLR